MPEKLTLEEIRRYWTAQAQTQKQLPAASWSDVWAIELEMREILKYLEDGERVLDVGCANGYSTVRYAAERRVQIRGVDYIPEMVAEARARLATMPTELAERVQFASANTMALDEPSGAYDKVVVVRVIINLGEWEAQLVGLKECARVVRPGGLLLLSEPTLQGWRRLNALRLEWDLPVIPMPSFNNYLDEELVTAALAPQLEQVALVNFSSSYFVGTRVWKPLLIQALGQAKNAADPEMEWNRWCSQLPAWGDYGTQKLFVFRKR